MSIEILCLFAGDEEIMAGGNQIEKRPREAAKTAEQIQMEQIQRETSREEAKAILKAIMLISSGVLTSPKI